MLKSVVKKLPLTSNRNEVLENLVQLTVINKGTLSVNVCGETIETDDVFNIDPTGTYFDFDLSEIEFSGSNNTENNVMVRYQKVTIPTTTQQPQKQNC